MKVTSDRASFTIGFQAENDEKALDHIKAWARKAKVFQGGSFRIIRSNGTEIDATDVVASYLDQAL